MWQRWATLWMCPHQQATTTSPSNWRCSIAPTTIYVYEIRAVIGPIGSSSLLTTPSYLTIHVWFGVIGHWAKSAKIEKYWESNHRCLNWGFVERRVCKTVILIQDQRLCQQPSYREPIHSRTITPLIPVTISYVIVFLCSEEDSLVTE